MPSPALGEQQQRSLTWPPTTLRHSTVDVDAKYMPATTPTIHPIIMPSTTRRKPLRPDSFEDEIDQDPAAHFLSPVKMVYEYDDWAEDSDNDNTEDVAWDAGIVDFAHFHSDRQQAQAGHTTSLPTDRWDSLLASQHSALQRAMQRNRSSRPEPTRNRIWTPPAEDVPHLTPDNSPNLRDSFDMERYCGRPAAAAATAARPSIPNYLQSNFTPAEELSDDDDYDDDDDETDSDEDELPVAYLVERARERRRAARKLERPGMRFNRTMSGKVHVWKRPGYQLPDVGEDAEAERRAELAYVQLQGGGGGRRRRRSPSRGTSQHEQRGRRR